MIAYRTLRWVWHVGRMEEGRSVFKILTDKRRGKGPLKRPRYKWEDILRINLKEIGVNTRGWVDSAQVRDYWRHIVNAG